MSHGVCHACRELHGNAQRAAQKAVKDGVLVKPDACSACGRKPSSPRDLHGHHRSYDQDKWLDVKWLCRSCHHQAHRDPSAPNCKQSVEFPVSQRDKYAYAGTPQDAARVGYSLPGLAS